MNAIFSAEQISEKAKAYIGKDTPASVAVHRELWKMRDEYEYVITQMRQEIERLRNVIEEVQS